jgi:ArsR family transcriptional regulator
MLASQPVENGSADTPQRSTLSDMAALCKAAGDPLRLQVLRVLRQDSFGVLELSAILDTRQPTMSHHLKVLTGAGLVASRREGNSIFYRRAALGGAPGLEELRASLFDSLDQLPLPADLEQRLAVRQLEREGSSREFFRQNADKFRAQQDLIASYSQYADTVAQMLGEAPLAGRGLALEVGPGDGSFLGELSPAFDSVIALDNAGEMLARARELAGESGWNNIRFIHGDTRHPSLADVRADCIVVNMVLHHTPSPADIFGDLAGCLAPGGVLLVTELCQHGQDWARTACGDLWLGFEPEDLEQWAGRAGLEEISSIYLAQRNGFQIQVRLFGHRNSPDHQAGQTL